eukprot:CAMPEP_0181288472 /NCGR_PEP_ID=MMETSP1101-20121128/349_1 /TAXON_ID=46948 /ORGANISM="Rhodomonas abbreviata, Strain Caron Lab Isolate" /LENGTH=338 /DNA_ID=CAMNT_0023392593 /DNA_START=131 /DNA_END=1147 /DNA_ORIENTATION=-
MDDTDNSRNSPKKKEIYTYNAPWTTYTMGWCRSNERKYQLAVGSYIEEYSNQIQIIELQKDDQGNGQFNKLCQFEHPYPPTKVMWAPEKHTGSDILATTGDYLRLWNLSLDNKVDMKGVLNNNKHSEYCAPLTSFDWNDVDPGIIGSCSIDTTCTIWDINAMAPKTQLIAHDKEVYDLAFACGKDIFGTVGADGSLRMFDLRSLEHSTILYESPDLSPLLKISWNKQDPNYIATIHTSSNKAIILDIRVPSAPVVELAGHVGALNGVVWAPQSSNHICTCGDDKQALIWDISTSKEQVVVDPILAFSAESEINQLQWDASHEDRVSICFSDCVQVLKV